jgi:hypothetical protein
MLGNRQHPSRRMSNPNTRLSRGHLACANAQSSCGRPNEDGRKIAAGTIEAADPRELVMKWSLFLARPSKGSRLRVGF